MKIIKRIMASIWIILVLFFLIFALIQKQEIKINDIKIKDLLMENLGPKAKMSNEYYENIIILKEKTDCKTIADSIFKSSEFLKKYEISYQKIRKEAKIK